MEVSKIEKTTEGFKVFFGDDHCTCDSVVLGIGSMGSPRKMGVPGEELSHVAYRLGDPDAFQDMDIIVVGAGDAAIENVLGLADKNRVSIINRKGEFARAKDANCALIEEAIESGKVSCFYDSTIARVESDQTVINTPNGEVVVPCQHLIARLGSIPPRKFMEACGIVFPSPNPTDVPVVDHRYESNVPGLYLLGSLIGYPLIKQAINQGYEVIEHILGNEVEPADQVLIADTLKVLPGDVNDNMDMIRKALPLFKGMSDPQFRELIVESTVHVKKEGEIIFERNDFSNTLFSVVSGMVQVELENKDRFELGPEDYFGEMGLISGRRRTATTSALKPTVLLETPRKQMLKLISSVEPIKNRLDDIFMYRTLKGFFPDVSGEQLWRLVAGAKLQKYKKDEVVFKEGDEGKYFHVIRKGSVKVSRVINGEDVTQTYIPVGNYFGATALIGYGEEGANSEPQLRTATITAAVECETSVIEVKDFLSFLKDNPEEIEKLQKVSQKWRAEDTFRDIGQDSGGLLDFALEKGLSDADNVLIIDSDLCVGCDNCEKACAATHGGYSRLDRKGGESFASIQVPTSCRHCQNPLCMTDCPPDALMRNVNGEVIIKDNCIGCGNCEKYCPYNVIQMVHVAPKSGGILSFLSSWFKSEDEEEPKLVAAKCDMCTDLKGGPACVRTCPTGAAMRISPSKMQELFSNHPD
ncbi:MAG: cyclic nucleotide-binding domain-containing protein [Nitrospinae bacterium]|nr:cyclic nucleotide-binding domain-containing protein [Nitrospinota bacterium]